MISFDEITGRDAYILSRALAMAIAINAHLPKHYQAVSDTRDMQKMLDTLFGEAVVKQEQARAANTVAAVEETYRPGTGDNG